MEGLVAVALDVAIARHHFQDADVCCPRSPVESGQHEQADSGCKLATLPSGQFPASFAIRSVIFTCAGSGGLTRRSASALLSANPNEPTLQLPYPPSRVRRRAGGAVRRPA